MRFALALSLGAIPAQAQTLSDAQIRALAGSLAQAQQVLLAYPDLAERLKTLQTENDALKKAAGEAKVSQEKDVK